MSKPFHVSLTPWPLPPQKRKITREEVPTNCASLTVVGAKLKKGTLMPASLAAGNQSQSLDEKTARTYELRLIALEKFARENGDDAVLFGPNKRPFLAATIQTFIRKFLYFLIQTNSRLTPSVFLTRSEVFFLVSTVAAVLFHRLTEKKKNTHCFCFGFRVFILRSYENRSNCLEEGE